MIPFNRPPVTGEEEKYIAEVFGSGHLCGDGPFTGRCSIWMEERFDAKRALLTTSGTAALDMAVLLCGLEPGAEVILPSFTFSSTANCILLAGGVPVFVDIRPDTMNIDEKLIEGAITDKTAAIMVVHYAGVACEMDKILEIAKKHDLMVIEDAAQGVMSSYNGKALGTIGDLGCYSFHETKNYSMGEGGAIIINDEDHIKRAEILREKGTNRTAFKMGQVDKYTWMDIGDSFLPSELNAAYLWAQLLKADEINERRLEIWNRYDAVFKEYEKKGRIECPVIPKGCEHNAHMYYIKLEDINDRAAFIEHMKKRDILCVYHYIPLHSAPAGLKYGRFYGEDRYTTRESERLVRLPLFFGMSDGELERVLEAAREFL